MAFTAFRGMKPWPQFVLTAFVVVICFLVLFVISLLIAIPVFGLNEMLASLAGGKLDDPQTIVILKYFQVTQSLGLFVIPPLVIAWLLEGNVAAYLHLDRPVLWRPALHAVWILLVFGPFVSYMGQLNSEMSFPAFLSDLEKWMRGMEDQAENLIDRFIRVETTGGLLFNLVMIAVIPAIGEEFLFRGVIQKIFTNMTRNYHWGIWISAILFSSLHMQFYGFIPRMLLGALFGYILVYSRSLWLPVLCHFVNNALGVLALYAGTKGQEDVEKIANYEFGASAPIMWSIALISLLFTIVLLVWMKTLNMASTHSE
ncbi:CPBP family intramembrane glutamic endopeptidase [Gaoshiqia sp. Z1-71]|uniref:CPBP family intramembrane glutamic endopeptidase n=1 Tax=Gaoshiqia hydrogeniformans TaxID=3290090 RepID=UPI003BF87292